MDDMQEGEESGPGVDEVMMQLLELLAQKRRGSRAESVLKPQPMTEGEEMESESPSEENEMGSLEEMLSDPELYKKVEEEEE